MPREETKDGVKIAILVEDGFEQVELTEPRKALEEAGMTTHVISPAKGSSVRGWQHDHWGDDIKIDRRLDEASSDDYDALLLPGGVMNPDKLRVNEKAVDFVRRFVEGGKPVAAICHGPWLLIEADAVRNRRATSYWSIKTDLINAGAKWLDEEVVVDNGMVTSRSPQDIPAFNRKMIEEIHEGIHPRAGGSAGGSSRR